MSALLQISEVRRVLWGAVWPRRCFRWNQALGSAPGTKAAHNLSKSSLQAIHKLSSPRWIGTTSGGIACGWLGDGLSSACTGRTEARDGGTAGDIGWLAGGVTIGKLAA